MTSDKVLAGSSLMHAAEKGSNRAIEVLLSAGTPVDATDKFGETALIHAARVGCERGVRALVAAKASLEISDK